MHPEGDVDGTLCVTEKTDDEQDGDEQKDGDEIVHVLPLIMIGQLCRDSH